MRCPKVIVFYHGKSKLTVKKAKELMRFCATSFITIGSPYAVKYLEYSNWVNHAIPCTTMGTVAAATFGPTGFGFVIVQLMMVAVVGFLAIFIAQAANQGQLANMIKVVSVFSCIGVVAQTAWKAINEVLRFIG